MPTIVNWPSADTFATPLPTQVLRDQFNFSADSGVIRDDTDAGYPLVRRRYTATTETYQLAMVMTFAQVTAFKNFFKNSPAVSALPGILYGSVLVEFPEPLWTGDDESNRPTDTFRWVTAKGTPPYSITPDGETSDFIVSFSLERLP